MRNHQHAIGFEEGMRRMRRAINSKKSWIVAVDAERAEVFWSIVTILQLKLTEQDTFTSEVHHGNDRTGELVHFFMLAVSKSKVPRNVMAWIISFAMGKPMGLEKDKRDLIVLTDHEEATLRALTGIAKGTSYKSNHELN